MINLAYSPTLSSLEIMITSNSKIFFEILEEFKKLKHTSREKEIMLHKLIEFTRKSKNSSIEDKNFEANHINDNIDSVPEEILNFSYERYLAEGNNLKLIVQYDLIKFEFFEIRPPHSRQILIKQIEDLLDSFNVIKKLKISDITNDSLFSILYSPFKSTKGLMMNSSFLVYYQLKIYDNDNTQDLNPLLNYSNTKNFTKNLFPNQIVNKNFVEVPVIGILPIKFENKIFMNPICKMVNSFMRNMNVINNNSNNYMMVKNLVVR